MQNSFQTPEWVKGSNVYEVNLRQYTPQGTFNAFANELTRLRAMGVEILWFMPITPISKQKRLGTLGSYYACSSYIDTNPEFGSIHDFKQLVKQAHDLGFKVIIDWVANHTGWDHQWTTEHPDYFKRNSQGNFYDAHGWEDVIDLDYTNPALRTSMLLAMKFWLQTCDIDGFRCDMAHLVPLEFWRSARNEMELVKKELFWLAETEEIIYHEVFDATYAWELLHTMEALYKGAADIKKMESVLMKYMDKFPRQAIHLAFTSNHDENSHSGSEYERLGEAAKAFAVLTATWHNCMPLVYSGQELPNKKRLRFFEKDEIDWTGNYFLNDFYNVLLSLHCSNTALHVANTENLANRLITAADDKIFAFIRQAGNKQVLVVLHLSPTAKIVFTLESLAISGKYKSAFSGITYDFTGPQVFEMRSWDYLVYEKVE